MKRIHVNSRPVNSRYLHGFACEKCGDKFAVSLQIGSSAYCEKLIRPYIRCVKCGYTVYFSAYSVHYLKELGVNEIPF